jgi:hypothetical protein
MAGLGGCMICSQSSQMIWTWEEPDELLGNVRLSGAYAEILAESIETWLSTWAS